MSFVTAGPAAEWQQPTVELTPRQERELWLYAERVKEKLTEVMATPGTLGLPELLEARRLKYGMPDGLFKHQAAYDRVLCYQIPRFETETFGDTLIVRPDSVKKKDREGAPRAVIVSAGMRALDNLRSNGMDLGHVVTFLRLSPWRFPAEMVEGHEFYLLPLYAGDIIASEDTAEELKTGKREVTTVVYQGRLEHCFKNEDGTVYRPWMADNSAEGY
jgi:hypothetical protein